ncbi:NALCN channel auxiliary factor 1 isoform X2 [Perognathus longimembris pacificus]|uniref:NALCN channel auxiliary factor 1 isoform X2 n=1 Tax=Perognathus longimembris pacificus TaxID=214514 RepID=UPI00201869A7|nr:NALCN channel auxiliary factor 1 isoform X2 [Perognathus longimembris pacificus]
MTRGAWMCRHYDDRVKIWLAAPRENEKPFIDSERAQKWRLSLASLLFFTVLLSDHLWFCAEAKLTRTRDKEQQQQQRQQQQQQQQQQRRQQQQQQQRPRQPEPSWPALLAGMEGASAPGAPAAAAAAVAAHRLLSASSSSSSSSPTLPPSPGGGGQGNRRSHHRRSRRQAPSLAGNSAKPAWRLESCYPPGSSGGQCFTVDSADAVCARNWSRGAAAAGEARQPPPPGWNLSDFYLSFCNSYTLWELFSGLSSPNTLNCSLDVALTQGGETAAACRQCVEAYQDYDHHAQEKYEEFESVLHKYLQSDEYSVKSCPEDCKIVYKAWLCSQYFEVTQFNCRKTIPCKQYCLEVQTRCPFILPDNDEVIYGGLSSFICTGEGEVYL